MTNFDDQELVNEFLVESYDNLDDLDRDFVALEKSPADLEILHRIFRCIHTIKGTCGFLGFSKLETVAHAGENLLSRLRDGELALTPHMTTALLEMVDAVREILGGIERDGREGDVDYSDLLATLEALQTGAATAPRDTAAATNEAASNAKPHAWKSVDAPAPELSGSRLGERLVARGDAAPNEIAAALLKQLQGDPRRLGRILVESGIVPEEILERILSEQQELEPHTIGELLMHAGVVGAEDVANALRAQLEGDLRAVGTILVDHGAATKQEVADALANQAAQNENVVQQPGISEKTIRVDVHLLDNMINTVGELVLARNQILQHASEQADSTLSAAAQRLNAAAAELQNGMMKMRMQPIGDLWNKFPRLVRDLAEAGGKNIRIELEGADTELDKTVLEAIKDPLTHIVRNAVDHGIERPEERSAAGKDEQGVLRLSAAYESGQVIIDITDDGGGINTERVRSRAVAKNILSEEKARRMSEYDAVNLIFAAGLSTAEEVTSISGRGVGMDVVRTNIENIGGAIDVVTNTGGGTSFRIKIPTTLGILRALIVTAGNERFAVPRSSLLELLRLNGGQSENAIEFIHGSPVYRLHGRLLPLVHLGEHLGISERPPFPAARPESSAAEAPAVMNVLVLEAAGRRFGLVVEQIHNTEELIVKPLRAPLTKIHAFAGAAIMGDGKVALVLDVRGIARQVCGANQASEHHTRQCKTNGGRQPVLLFKTTNNDRMAVPLDRVDRLESFPRESVQKAGTLDVVQYRDDIMPLVEIGGHGTGFDNARGNENGEHEPFPVVVCALDGKNVGLRVGEILDIAEEDLAVEGHSDRYGVLFTAVIQGELTEIIDTAAVVRQSIPGFAGGAGEFS